jgi:hypothetical protein
MSLLAGVASGAAAVVGGGVMFMFLRPRLMSTASEVVTSEVVAARISSGVLRLLPGVSDTSTEYL